MPENKFLKVNVWSFTYGKDGKLYVTIYHPKSKNKPTLLFEEEDLENIQDEIKKNGEKN